MKEKLKNYRALKLELEDVDAQINSGTVQDSVQASQSEHPWVKGTRRISGAPDEDYNLLVRKSDLKAQIKEIEEFVESIDDNIVYKTVIIKFIEIKKDGKGRIIPPPKWFQVAQQVNCGLSGDGLRMRVKRYLKKS